VTSTTSGKFYDLLKPEDRALLREGVMAWSWDVKNTTHFTHGFGGNDEAVNQFPAMMASARAVSGAQNINLYAHNLSEAAVRGSVSGRTVVPHRRRTRRERNGSDAVVRNRLGHAGEYGCKYLLFLGSG
jgi:hypothetical protein